MKYFLFGKEWTENEFKKFSEKYNLTRNATDCYIGGYNCGTCKYMYTFINEKGDDYCFCTAYKKEK